MTDGRYGDETAFSIFSEALSNVRDQVMYQIHFVADYSRNTYGWTLDLDALGISYQRTDHEPAYNMAACNEIDAVFKMEYAPGKLEANTYQGGNLCGKDSHNSEIESAGAFAAKR